VKYHPEQIEKKWQAYWKQHKTFKTTENAHQKKYYVLDMFPYPSGAGLHVGHLLGYTATDIIARIKRHQGYNVLHPMGWDSFGLPAEQYAVRTGTHPAITTKANIQNFKRQLEAVGYSYDWDRAFATSDPKYYKWTQWIFTKLYERGLAYQADLMVNYCPALGTVLANEEIESGKSKEGGYPIERRPLRQWVLKITAYADRLLEDLKEVDWPEGLKKLQTNWIGRSEGASLSFSIENGLGEITVFTTRPDTLFGVTYLVLAPEHPLLETIVPPAFESQVRAYQKSVSAKSEFERSEIAKTKSGVFTGAYALHPITLEKIPIWTADYVLMGYGTGSVMAVPAHDERDFAFASQFNLKIAPVVAPQEDQETKCWSGKGICIHSHSPELSLDGLSTEEAKRVVIDFLEKKGIGKGSVHYKLRDWLFSRQRYWGEPFPLLHLPDGSIRALELDELPLVPPEISDYKPSSTGESPLAKVREWVEVFDAKTGMKALRETNTMPQWAGSCWYYLRFCDPQNDVQAWDEKKEAYWMPVDLYVGGAEHAVLHLLYARFWHKVLFDCGLVSTKEPFQRLCNQGILTARSFQKEGGGYVAPEEAVEKGGEWIHAKTQEKLRSQMEKMSKSKLNGVSPDEIIEEFGADSMRLYSMFMGPIEKEKIWNTDGVNGCHRFLQRFYEMTVSEKVSDQESEEALRLLHLLIKGVSDDVEKMLFNTAVAKMMEFVNDFNRLTHYPKAVLKEATILLSPFAPHLAEEIWESLGEKETIAYAPWPKADPKYLEQAVVTYVIQVNGKLRGRFELPKDQAEEAIIALAKENPGISKHLQGVVQKVIFVPNKLLNFVLE